MRCVRAGTAVRADALRVSTRTGCDHDHRPAGCAMIRALVLALLFVPQLALAKPLRCGTVTYRDNGSDVLIGALPEVAWQGGLGTKPLRCCVLDLRWLLTSPLLYDIRYFKVPPDLEARCVAGKHRPARLRVNADGHGTFSYAWRRGICGVEVSAAAAGPLQGTIGGTPYLPPGVLSASKSKPCKYHGMTLTSVGGAFVGGIP